MSTRETNIRKIVEWLEAHELKMMLLAKQRLDVQAERLANAQTFHDLIGTMVKADRPTVEDYPQDTLAGEETPT